MSCTWTRWGSGWESCQWCRPAGTRSGNLIPTFSIQSLCHNPQLTSEWVGKPILDNSVSWRLSDFSQNTRLLAQVHLCPGPMHRKKLFSFIFCVYLWFGADLQAEIQAVSMILAKGVQHAVGVLHPAGPFHGRQIISKVGLLWSLTSHICTNIETSNILTRWALTRPLSGSAPAATSIDCWDLWLLFFFFF